MVETTVPTSAANLQPRYKPAVSENQHRRRDLLGRIAGVPAAAVPVTASAVEAEDPHIAWGVEERRLYAEFLDAFNADQDERAAELLERRWEVYRRIVDMPTTTLAGLATILRLITTVADDEDLALDGDDFDALYRVADTLDHMAGRA